MADAANPRSTCAPTPAGPACVPSVAHLGSRLRTIVNAVTVCGVSSVCVNRELVSNWCVSCAVPLPPPAPGVVDIR